MSLDAWNPARAGAALAPDGPRHRRLFIAGMACALLALVPLALIAHRVPYFAIDLTITRLVQGAQGGWIDRVLAPLNVLGFPPVPAIVYGSIVLAILVAGGRWEAVSLALAAVGASGLNQLMKALVDRPRPSMELVHVAHQLPPGSSFPAGHVLNFTAFAGLLCYLATVRLASSWLRSTLIAILVAMMVLMGIARIRAGEHWPSDVLGGYLIGVVWWAATVVFYRWVTRRRPAPPGVSVRAIPRLT